MDWLRIIALGFLLFSAGLSGCASITTGQNQSITVETTNCEGATCELANDKGKWVVRKVPGSVVVHRSIEPLSVSCTKEVHGRTVSSRDPEQASMASAESKTKGMAFGNIIFGGLIGAAIDVGTGAAYDYPQVITVPMECESEGGGVHQAVRREKGRLGVRVLDVSSEVAIENRLPDSGGALVTHVSTGSVADRSGIRVGDVIREFGGISVRDAAHLSTLLNRQEEGGVVVKVATSGGGRVVRLQLNGGQSL